MSSYTSSESESDSTYSWRKGKKVRWSSEIENEDSQSNRTQSIASSNEDLSGNDTESTEVDERYHDGHGNNSHQLKATGAPVMLAGRPLTHSTPRARNAAFACPNSRPTHRLATEPASRGCNHNITAIVIVTSILSIILSSCIFHFSCTFDLPTCPSPRPVPTMAPTATQCSPALNAADFNFLTYLSDSPDPFAVFGATYNDVVSPAVQNTWKTRGASPLPIDTAADEDPNASVNGALLPHEIAYNAARKRYKQLLVAWHPDKRSRTGLEMWQHEVVYECIRSAWERVEWLRKSDGERRAEQRAVYLGL